MNEITKISKTDAEWRAELSPEAYKVLRQHGTERPFSGQHQSQGAGVFKCAGCGLELFDGQTEFDSGTGWPSFFQPIEGHVEEKSDRSLWMKRTEVLCARCEGHLGHVFDDGPNPTGLRYCMNSVAMKFEEEGK
jgi:peptide-methionine (R)-S-oxide reductase